MIKLAFSMFAYLRYFSVISAIVITLAAIALGYYFRSSAGADLRDLVIKNNHVLVQGFINKVWKEHEMVKMLELFRKHDVPLQNWPRYRGYKENFESFQRDVFGYFEEMPVVHVTLYDAKGAVLLSFNQHEILQAGAIGVQVDDTALALSALQQAIQGTRASNILENSEFKQADGSRQSGTLVQTIIPIVSDNYVPLLAGAEGYDKQSNLEGVVEIYYDITRQWSKLSQFQYVATGAILLIFMLLIATLIMVASKAESIIAKQHESNLELAAQAAAAETENENKSQFLASISHELRTPLNAIIGFSEIIKNETMGPIGNEQYKDYMRDIHNSGVHLLSLINDILDYSKAEAGKLDLNIEEIDITKLIQSCMRLVAPRAEHAEVSLTTEIPKEHYLLHTDSKKVKQVMLNLLSNAVKFTPEGGEVRVILWQDVLENRVTVEVRDSGIGIAPKDISKALSPFGQVDSALSRKYEGTGLGLPLTKKFVEIMGGLFEIESAEGEGTRVRFSLPINAPLPTSVHSDPVEAMTAQPPTTTPKVTAQDVVKSEPSLMKAADHSPSSDELPEEPAKLKESPAFAAGAHTLSPPPSMLANNAAPPAEVETVKEEASVPESAEVAPAPAAFVEENLEPDQKAPATTTEPSGFELAHHEQTPPSAPPTAMQQSAPPLTPDSHEPFAAASRATYELAAPTPEPTIAIATEEAIAIDASAPVGSFQLAGTDDSRISSIDEVATDEEQES